jgi:transglutaminase/protease-like cytokinesis protein 3
LLIPNPFPTVVSLPPFPFLASSRRPKKNRSSSEESEGSSSETDGDDKKRREKKRCNGRTGRGAGGRGSRGSGGSKQAAAIAAKEKGVQEVMGKTAEHFKLCMTQLVNIRPSCKACREVNKKKRKTWVKKGRLFVQESYCKLCTYTALRLSSLLYGVSENALKAEDSD